MIDASGFATHHISFWSDCAPTLEHFVRRLNLDYVERSEPPLFKPSSRFRAAFVAEVAFSRLCLATQGISKETLQGKAVSEGRLRLTPLLNDPTVLDKPLSKDERLQVGLIEGRLAGFFKSRMDRLSVRPVFRGCGFIDASEGDAICGKTLYEVKAVDRSFRSVDVRQLITYCALNHASRQYDILKVGLYNPRRGVFFEMDIDRVCREMAGISRQELFDGITHVLSSGDISR